VPADGPRRRECRRGETVARNDRPAGPPEAFIDRRLGVEYAVSVKSVAWFPAALAGAPWTNDPMRVAFG